MELEPQFFQQLNNLQSRLMRSGLIKSGTWDATENPDPEEEIIRNTFLNARQGPADDPYFTKHLSHKPRKPKLQWRDKESGKIAVEIKYSAEDRISQSAAVEPKKLKLKSILKGSNRVFDFRPTPPPQSLEREKADESRNKSSKSVLEKGEKKQLAVEAGEPKLSTKSLYV